MDRTRALIEECCGWNRKTWADAVEFAIAMLPEDLSGYRVLEIGASDRSALAPLFVARGADVLCSYYRKPKDFIENGSLRRICSEYRVAIPSMQEVDINNIEGTYDLIVMKSVLGGICRNEDYQEIGALVRRLSRSLSDRGMILTVDNGHVRMFQRLRTLFGTGGNTWTYVRSEEFRKSLAGFDLKGAGFGFFNCATASLQVGFDCEFLNDFIYFFDKLVLRLFKPTERAVLSTVIRALPAAAS